MKPCKFESLNNTYVDKKDGLYNFVSTQGRNLMACPS